VNNKKNQSTDNAIIKKAKINLDKANRNILLIDNKNIYNPHYVTEFVYDIFEHLKETEVKIYLFIILLKNLYKFSAY